VKCNENSWTMQKIHHFINCFPCPFCRQTSAHDDSSLTDQSRTLDETAKLPDNEPHMQLRHKNVIPDDEGTNVFAVSWVSLKLPCKIVLIDVVCASLWVGVLCTYGGHIWCHFDYMCKFTLVGTEVNISIKTVQMDYLGMWRYISELLLLSHLAANCEPTNAC